MARGRRRSGGRRSGGLDWAPPVPGAPTLAERLESGDLPVGLTAEEVAEALPQLFEGLAPNTKEAYAKFARYFKQWCLPRGIRLEQVETAHIRTYMRAARRRRVRPVSVSWLWSTLAGVRLSMRFEGLSGRVNWNELADFVYDEHLEGKSPPVQADGPHVGVDLRGFDGCLDSEGLRVARADPEAGHDGYCFGHVDVGMPAQAV